MAIALTETLDICSHHCSCMLGSQCHHLDRTPAAKAMHNFIVRARHQLSKDLPLSITAVHQVGAPADPKITTLLDQQPKPKRSYRGFVTTSTDKTGAASLVEDGTLTLHFPSYPDDLMQIISSAISSGISCVRIYAPLCEISLNANYTEATFAEVAGKISRYITRSNTGRRY